MEKINGDFTNWMQTYTGRGIFAHDPKPEDFHLEDIAHALSMCCRYTGHVCRFYSVAEHSVYVSKLVPPEMAKIGLLHDASEAYLSDIARGIKNFMPDYKAHEDRLMEQIAKRFDIPWPMPVEVKKVDLRICYDERDQLMNWGPWHENDKTMGYGITIEGMSPEQAKQFFLDRCRELGVA